MADSRNSGRYLAPALVACAAATAAGAAPRQRSSPSIGCSMPRRWRGPRSSGCKISPDASRVTYLQGKPEDKDRLDLWEYNIHDKAARGPGRFEGPGAGEGEALRRGTGPPRAAANRGALRHPRILLCALRDGRCCFRSTAGSTTTISPNPPTNALTEISRRHRGICDRCPISPHGGYRRLHPRSESPRL